MPCVGARFAEMSPGLVSREGEEHMHLRRQFGLAFVSALVFGLLDSNAALATTRWVNILSITFSSPGTSCANPGYMTIGFAAGLRLRSPGQHHGADWQYDQSVDGSYGQRQLTPTVDVNQGESK